ncbi:MAG: molybdate transport system permease protein [Variibacter sp.]|jgi:molybdate transport system permease protein|nr:molybdate transport system permease protein [Variibacter sp.]
MDWLALSLSLRLGLFTVLCLIPLGLIVARALAYRDFPGKAVAEALITLPLVLPPTVLGYYLLVAFGGASPVGQLWQNAFGKPLIFSFEALLIASIIVNLPFAVQPMQRGFEAIPRDVRDAAACCGLPPLAAFWRVELPLAWPAIATALVLSFAHTLGEFGVVLMVGGSVPGETQTIAIAIYDRVQAFDNAAAARMSALLLAFSLTAVALTFALSRRVGRRTV